MAPRMHVVEPMTDAVIETIDMMPEKAETGANGHNDYTAEMAREFLRTTPPPTITIIPPAPPMASTNAVIVRQRCASFFGLAWHSWVALEPSRAQQEEIRQLISNGDGRLGFLGVRDEEVVDRVCSRCHRSEHRLGSYVDALRRARGLAK